MNKTASLLCWGFLLLKIDRLQKTYNRKSITQHEFNRKHFRFNFMLLHHLSLLGHVGLIHILHFLGTEQIKQDLQEKKPQKQ